MEWSRVARPTSVLFSLEKSTFEKDAIAVHPMHGYAYWGFLGVGTMLDIFQNIHILYLQYYVLVFSGYGVLSLFPLLSLVSAGMDTAYLH
ncbi:hypothetical protein Tco_0503217 [Tanacetum coccineum]